MALSDVISKEATFPRGGRVRKIPDANTSVEKKPRREKDLFSSSASVTKDVQAQKKQRKKKLAKEKAKNNEDESKQIEAVETLSYGHLVEGMVIMGKISTIRELDLRISLPGRLMATCPITNISSSYTNALKDIAQGQKIEVDSDEYPRPLPSMFKVGQVVICCVTDISKNDESFYQITVSLDPTKTQGSILTKKILVDWKISGHMPILVAAIKSIEEHGYVMDIGVQGARAFLPTKKISKYAADFLQDGKVSIGQLVSCRVSEVTNDGLDIRLTCEPSKLAKQLLKMSSNTPVSIHTLLPGTQINCTTSDVPCKGGIKVDLGNELSGYIHRDHFDGEGSYKEEGFNFNARVIYIIPTLNTIHLSAKPNFGLSEKPVEPFKHYKVGDLVKDAKVVETSRRGLILEFPASEITGDVRHLGFVPARHMTGAKEVEKNFHKKFEIGSLKSCRIFQYDYSDDIFLCSLQKIMLEQSVMKIEDLAPGDFITGKVKRLERRGIFLDIGIDLPDAFIPALHMSDVPLKNPEKKFSIGDKLKCRVLRVEPEKKKLFLTAKNILVNEEYPIIHQYDVQNIGKVTEGVVVSVSTEGLLLTLFGETRGWVPKKMISAEGPIEYPEKLFFVGQALKCQVMDVDVERARMTLSLIIGGTSKPLGQKEKSRGQKLKLCKSYACKVVDIATDGLGVEIEEKIDANKTENIKAFIPKEHLTDHPSMADLLLASYKVGDSIEQAICFERDVIPIMTLKPIILNDIQENECKYENGRSYEELNDGLVIPGVVCLVKQYGIFVRLPTRRFRKSALIPTRHLSDTFVDSPHDFVKNKQTIYGKILERKENLKEITMSAKLKDVINPNEPSVHSVNLLESLFLDMQRIENCSTLSCNIGMVVTCSVVNTSEFGIETDVKIDNEEKEVVRGLIPKSSCAGIKEPVVGDILCAVVVYVEHQFRCVELSPQQDLITKVTLRSDKSHLIKEEQVVKASVILRRSELGFVSLCIQSPNHLAGHFVHVPARNHINDVIGFTDLYTLGETYSIVIKKKLVKSDDNIVLIGMLEKHLKTKTGVVDKETTRKRQRVDSITSQTSEASDLSVEINSLAKAPPKPKINVATKRKKISKDIDLSVLNALSTKILSDAKNNKIAAKDEQPAPDVEEQNTNSKISAKSNDEKLAPPGWDDNYNPWAGVVDVKEENVSEDEDEELKNEADPKDTSKSKKHLSKKEKKELDRLEAAEISRLEQQVLKGENAEPVTAAEYDRLVLTSPDSSLCWIKYMAFHISKKDYDSAREVAAKALEKINFREEGERLNVYMAWFNLENSFGSSENAETCFKEALKCNDEFKVYSQVGQVYENDPKSEEKAEKIYKAMARKFGKEPEAWIKLGKHYFTRQDKNLKEARFTLQRALQNLEKKEHIGTSAKFAQFEFQFGEPERGKQIFENIISNFPKKLDQWNVYIDLVIKNKETEFARDLFERMIGLNLKPVKMKSMFKKYMEFEEKQSGEDKQIRTNNVRRKAAEYLETLGIKMENDGDEVMESIDDHIQ